MVAKKKLHRKQLCFRINIHVVQPLSSIMILDSLLWLICKSQEAALPLLGLVCFVCGEEGHAVGSEVGVEV